MVPHGTIESTTWRWQIFGEDKKVEEHKFLQHIRRDHQEQKKLADKLIQAQSTEERGHLRQQFYNSLYPHMIGEEASIFRFLSQAEEQDIRDDSLEGLQEHHVGKIVLHELMELDTQSETFKAKAKVLDELNRHHIGEEEKNIFAHLQKLCDNNHLDELFDEYEAAEEKVKSD